MKISEKLRSVRPAFSFEFFPPKDEEGVDRLFETVRKLGPYEPAFVSVTYGAGGSTRRLTVELVQRIKNEAGLETMAHLTCVGASRSEVAEVLDQLSAGAIDNVIALRGDPPRGETTFVTPEGGFARAVELVAFIRARYDFCVAAACYPETHPEAVSAGNDLLHAKAKVDAGADLLISQLFFDPAVYFDFVERARAAGILVPIVPGIMPITNLSQVKRITKMCGAGIPAPLLARLEATGGEATAVQRIGVEHATEQCRQLLAGGAPGIHFYTLNRSHATVDILDRLRG
ncbi:MAG TPA: methylenetetrahydrofolate reductase [NAD(P)H] [Polyangiaceae bacterium]|nr:methylenetetrahydrofolate reductase [NAD(P)H] [Polyangiaceae bacterium]